VSINDDDCNYTLEKFRASQKIDNLYVILRNHTGGEFDIDLTMLKVRNGKSQERLVVEHEGEDYSVTASIGLAQINPTDTSTKAIMARADEGSYLAKGRGRNQVVVVPGA